MVLAYAWLELCCEVTGTYAHAWLKVASIAKRRSFLGAALLIMRPASRDQHHNSDQFRTLGTERRTPRASGPRLQMVRRISSFWMGKHKDVQQRTRKAAAPAQQAARSSVIARKAAGEKNNAVEAAVAARATCQASLLASWAAAGRAQAAPHRAARTTSRVAHCRLHARTRVVPARTLTLQ